MVLPEGKVPCLHGFAGFAECPPSVLTLARDQCLRSGGASLCASGCAGVVVAIGCGWLAAQASCLVCGQYH